jgi:hypothetical protein
VPMADLFTKVMQRGSSSNLYIKRGRSFCLCNIMSAICKQSPTLTPWSMARHLEGPPERSEGREVPDECATQPQSNSVIYFIFPVTLWCPQVPIA